jgi:Domain of unknown function (DUF4410)
MVGQKRQNVCTPTDRAMFSTMKFWVPGPDAKQRNDSVQIILLRRESIRFFPIGYRLSCLLICVLLSSCASVSVKKIEVLTGRPPARGPAKILVKPPTFYDPNLRVDRSGAKLENFKYDLQEKFTRHLVRRLSREVAPAEAVAATAPLPRGNYWLITGRFDRVDQGSRLLRSVIGLGAGGTRLDMSVVVFDLASRKPRPFLLIETTGGSKADLGAIGTATYLITGLTALFSAGDFLEGTRSGLTFDTIRTAREVAASLSEYLSQRHVSPEKQALRPDA